MGSPLVQETAKIVECVKFCENHFNEHKQKMKRLEDVGIGLAGNWNDTLAVQFNQLLDEMRLRSNELQAMWNEVYKTYAEHGVKVSQGASDFSSDLGRVGKGESGSGTGDAGMRAALSGGQTLPA